MGIFSTPLLLSSAPLGHSQQVWGRVGVHTSEGQTGHGPSFRSSQDESPGPTLCTFKGHKTPSGPLGRAQSEVVDGAAQPGVLGSWRSRPHGRARSLPQSAGPAGRARGLGLQRQLLSLLALETGL